MPSQMNPVDVLAAHPILRLGAPTALRAVAAQCRAKLFSAGATVVTTGTAQTEVLLLGRGQVSLSRRNKEAKTQMLTGVVRAPGLLGDAELYSESGRWLVTVRAVQPTHVVFIPNAIFDGFVSAHQEVAYALYKDACARHYLAVSINQVMALQKTPHRILRLLAAQNPTGGKTPVDISVVSLANALGVNRRTVMRNLASLEKQGWLVREGEAVFLQVSDTRAFTIDNLKGGLGAAWTLPSEEEAS